MRPAERAVARVDPQLADFGLANEGNIRRRCRSQSGPEMRLAALVCQSRVAHTGQDLLDAVGQHLAARLRQRRVKRQVITTDFNRAGHPQEAFVAIAQTAHRAFDFVVNRADIRCELRLEHSKARAVALARVDRQIHANRAQQRRRIRSASHDKGVRCQMLDFSAILACSARFAGTDSY